MNNVLVAIAPCGCRIAIMWADSPCGVEFTSQWEGVGCAVLTLTEEASDKFPPHDRCHHGSLGQQLAARVKSLEQIVGEVAHMTYTRTPIRQPAIFVFETPWINSGLIERARLAMGKAPVEAGK